LELETHYCFVLLELEFPYSDIQLELDIHGHVVQLELYVLCRDVQLELDVHLVNRSIKAYIFNHCFL
jgi:hypothetical protein